jgi:hypothetical protein
LTSEKEEYGNKLAPAVAKAAFFIKSRRESERFMDEIG